MASNRHNSIPSPMVSLVVLGYPTHLVDPPWPMAHEIGAQKVTQVKLHSLVDHVTWLEAVCTHVTAWSTHQWPPQALWMLFGSGKKGCSMLPKTTHVGMRTQIPKTSRCGSAPHSTLCAEKSGYCQLKRHMRKRPSQDISGLPCCLFYPLRPPPIPFCDRALILHAIM